MDLQKTLAQEGPELIPSLPAELIADVKHMKCLEPYRDELIQGAQVRQNLAILRQRRIGETVRQLEFVRRGEMRIIAQVDWLHFHQLRNSSRGGRGCWNNREWVADTLKKNPEMAVESRNERGRITVGYTRPAPRTRQVYPSPGEECGAPDGRAASAGGSNEAAVGSGHGNVAGRRADLACPDAWKVAR